MLRVSKLEYLFDPLQRLRSPSVEYKNFNNKSSEILQDSSEIIELNKDLLFHLNPYINTNKCTYEINDGFNTLY